MLNTESAELGSVVTQEPAQQLPLNGRNFSQLGVLVPGANSGAVGSIRRAGKTTDRAEVTPDSMDSRQTRLALTLVARPNFSSIHMPR